jgi:8-oxo-dGTP pyrophosphatase MutT (NUDIX family)
VYVEWSGRLLLIRERNLKNGRLLWNIIKGSVEKTDDTLYDAAIRECREEAGVKVKPYGVIGISYRRRRINPVTQVNLLASSTSGHTKLATLIRQRRLNEEIVEARYFTRTKLLKLERRECMNDRVWRGVRKWAR